MKRPFKLLPGPGDGISAFRALLINKLGHVALILLCHSAVRRNERPSFVFSSRSTNTSPFFSFLCLNCGFLLHGGAGGRFTCVATAPEPPPEPPAEPAPRPAAEPVVESNQVFFLSLPLCGTCFGLFSYASLLS